MNTIARQLHEIFNSQRRFTFPFHAFLNEIPQNGIYLLFEKGEKYGNIDRIVRVGTHTGSNQLRSRLYQHFVKENKNRSIFRKNIGRCLLNRDNHPYLDIWEFDYTSKADKERNVKFLDLEFENKIEKQISNYIQANFSFCVFRVNEKEARIFWERKIISTLAKDPDAKPSEKWLGNYSPKEKIKTSGLWQVNELFKESIDLLEFEELKKKLL